MYSLSTLSALNAKETNSYFARKPLKRVLIPEDVRFSPDYSGGSAEAIAEHFRVKIEGKFFVDSSGFGSDSEAALTFDNFSKQIKALLSAHPNKKFYSALTGVGQFQVYVAFFSK